jgi:hypothetical protein
MLFPMPGTTGGITGALVVALVEADMKDKNRESSM